MPADYSSAAAALSLSASPLPSPSPGEPDTGSTAPWARPRASSARRVSRPYNLNRSASQPYTTQLLHTITSLSNQAWAFFLRLPLLHRIAVAAVLALLTTLSILFLVYSHKIFAWLGPVAKDWREHPLGWLLIWLMVFVTAFPPMMGYGTASTLAGFVFRFPLGWPIVATASVAGSTAAFYTSRGVFSGYVHSLVGSDKRFVALGQVLRHDGLLVLTGVRFCPLPYSLSNGFLATIPSITPWAFAVSTALASPKLLVHVFIGSRLAKLAEEGDEMSAGGKAVNYISIFIGGLVGLVVGLYVYKRTMARAAELAREEAEEIAADAGDDYVDNEDARLMDPNDANAAALMEDDDISLWDANGFEDDRNGYRDSDEPSPKANGKKTKFLDEEAAIGLANGSRR